MFSFEGAGIDGMDTFDINLIQQTFNQATAGLSNDFFSFGGSMFGDTSSFQPPPSISNHHQDPATMFDFSTLDPNFMSLVNSFDSTFQSQQQPQLPIQSQPVQPVYQPSTTYAQPQSQPPNLAATVSDQDFSTGLTPFLNQDYSPMPSDPLTSSSTGMPLSADAPAPTPARHFEHLSQTVAYNAGSNQTLPQAHAGQPTWNINPNNDPVPPVSTSRTPSSGTGSDHPLYPKVNAGPNESGADVLLSQALGDKSPEDPSAYAAQANSSYSTAFQKPADSRAGLGAALDQEGYELVGGWFDANDLPRVARDHL
jgi:hypothetical protein